MDIYSKLVLRIMDFSEDCHKNITLYKNGKKCPPIKQQVTRLELDEDSCCIIGNNIDSCRNIGNRFKFVYIIIIPGCPKFGLISFDEKKFVLTGQQPLIKCTTHTINKSDITHCLAPGCLFNFHTPGTDMNIILYCEQVNGPLSRNILSYYNEKCELPGSRSVRPIYIKDMITNKYSLLEQSETKIVKNNIFLQNMYSESNNEDRIELHNFSENSLLVCICYPRTGNGYRTRNGALGERIGRAMIGLSLEQAVQYIKDKKLGRISYYYLESLQQLFVISNLSIIHDVVIRVSEQEIYYVSIDMNFVHSFVKIDAYIDRDKYTDDRYLNVITSHQISLKKEIIPLYTSGSRSVTPVAIGRENIEKSMGDDLYGKINLYYYKANIKTEKPIKSISLRPYWSIDKHKQFPFLCRQLVIALLVLHRRTEDSKLKYYGSIDMLPLEILYKIIGLSVL